MSDVFDDSYEQHLHHHKKERLYPNRPYLYLFVGEIINPISDNNKKFFKYGISTCMYHRIYTYNNSGDNFKFNIGNFRVANNIEEVRNAETLMKRLVIKIANNDNVKEPILIKCGGQSEAFYLNSTGIKMFNKIMQCFFKDARPLNIICDSISPGIDICMSFIKIRDKGNNKNDMLDDYRVVVNKKYPEYRQNLINMLIESGKSEKYAINITGFINKLSKKLEYNNNDYNFLNRVTDVCTLLDKTNRYYNRHFNNIKIVVNTLYNDELLNKYMDMK